MVFKTVKEKTINSSCVRQLKQMDLRPVWDIECRQEAQEPENSLICLGWMLVPEPKENDTTITSALSMY